MATLILAGVISATLVALSAGRAVTLHRFVMRPGGLWQGAIDTGSGAPVLAGGGFTQGFRDQAWPQSQGHSLLRSAFFPRIHQR